MPHKVQLHQQYKDQGLEVVTLNMEGEESLQAAKDVLQRLNITVANLCLAEGLSEDGLAAVEKQDAGLPAVHFYDRKGRLRYRLNGAIDDEEVEQHIGELLNE